MGKDSVQAKQWLDKSYSDSAPPETTVKKWYAGFNHGRTHTNDAECSGRPNSSVVPENTKKLNQLVLPDRKLMLREIAKELKISDGSVFTILPEHLSMRKLCSKLMLRMPKSIKNNNALPIQSGVFNCFNATKRSFA